MPPGSARSGRRVFLRRFHDQFRRALEMPARQRDEMQIGDDRGFPRGVALHGRAAQRDLLYVAAQAGEVERSGLPVLCRCGRLGHADSIAQRRIAGKRGIGGESPAVGENQRPAGPMTMRPGRERSTARPRCPAIASAAAAGLRILIWPLIRRLPVAGSASSIFSVP